MDCVFGVVSKKASPYPRLSRLTHVILWEFYSLWFAFRSMIHSELIFVKNVSLCLGSFFLHVNIRLFWHHLLKVCLAPLHCLCSFVRTQWTKWGCTVGNSILFHRSAHLFFCQYDTVWTTPGLWWVLTHQSLNFVLLQYCAGHCGSYASPYTLQNQSSISTKQHAKVFTGIAWSLWINLRKPAILTIVSIPIHEHGIALH